MTRFVNHDLKLSLTRDEQAAQDFVSSLRAHVLNDMSASMKRRWEHDIAPTRPAQAETTESVHAAIRHDPYFRFYSATRVAAQEMVWASVHAPVSRAAPGLAQKMTALRGKQIVAGTLDLDPNLTLPENVTSIDVHLMPGNYHREAGMDDLSAGALYDNGLSVFSFGLMGETLDDIGQSITTYVKARWPDFAPKQILDLGCTVGHQTLPWKRTYPDAAVTGIDVAAPCLRYAHARAQFMGIEAHFSQQDARATRFADQSFDLIFSSMFLHELPVPDIKAVFAECRRLLKPGGLMLHYELPPNDAMTAYDGFYLDWDSSYNNEPWYKGFRDQNLRSLCADAGFDPEAYLDFVTPSLGLAGHEGVVAAATAGTTTETGDTVGRLADGVQWFAFGNWA
jgi:ubiquinone/menaquinone biosynthesis C-methylase UbiE